jgi:prophage regulatory protein
MDVRISRALHYAASGAVARNKGFEAKKEGVANMKPKGVALEQRSGRSGVGVLETNASKASSTVPLRLLRFGEVRQRTGLSRSTIWRMERSGVFPQRVRISVNVVAWREDEVTAWIASKIQGVRNAAGDAIVA